MWNDIKVKKNTTHEVILDFDSDELRRVIVAGLNAVTQESVPLHVEIEVRPNGLDESGYLKVSWKS